MGEAEVELGTDAEVLARARAQPRAFAALFDRHFQTIHRYLARRVGSDLADDLAGEVFRVAFERRESFDPAHDTSARPWLYGIATNLVHRERRSEERRLRAIGRLTVHSAAPAGDAFDGVDERLDAAVAARDAVAAVTRLPVADRDALLLFAVEGLSYAEVAIALGIPVGTVRSRISRARMRVRELLGAPGKQRGVWPEAEEAHDG